MNLSQSGHRYPQFGRAQNFTHCYGNLITYCSINGQNWLVIFVRNEFLRSAKNYLRPKRDRVNTETLTLSG